MRFVRTSTGQNTRPAPQPGLGFESDKFDPAALDAHFEAFVGSLLRAIGPRENPPRAGLTSLHVDSWEMGAQNWSARFAEEFRRAAATIRCRYLPVMAGRVVESLEISERFLWDLRQTAQELIVQNHAWHLRELAGSHGLGLSIEPYDMNPCSDLSLGSAAEVPMCEFWAKGYGFSTEFSCIEAVSIAHALGRPIVAAEAFTATRRRGVAAVSGRDEGAGRLGALHGHQSHRLSPLRAPAVAGPAAGDDDGPVRRPLGPDAVVVGPGARVSPLPRPLPVPVAAG